MRYNLELALSVYQYDPPNIFVPPLIQCNFFFAVFYLLTSILNIIPFVALETRCHLLAHHVTVLSFISSCWRWNEDSIFMTLSGCLCFMKFMIRILEAMLSKQIFMWWNTSTIFASGSSLILDHTAKLDHPAKLYGFWGVIQTFKSSWNRSAFMDYLTETIFKLET